MTYTTGGPIQAADYNALATLALSDSMNKVFADAYPGATTLPDAGFGYGQTPALTSVSTGDPVTAVHWSNLFQTIKKCGTHQGTTVVPPLPVTDPVAGDVIVVFNTPTALSVITTLINTNRFNIAPGQSTLTLGTSYSQPGAAIPWTTSLLFSYNVDFGNWDNARYFFNSGGSLNLNGSMAPLIPTPTPEEAMWISMFGDMNPLVFNWNSTSPNAGGGGTSIGFYNLTTSYQSIYNKAYGGIGYYSGSYVSVRAKLANTAGTSGLINFTIELVDADLTPTPKLSTTTYRVDTIRATGVDVSYPGTVTISTSGANTGFTAT
jgi:hypothetical protein